MIYGDYVALGSAGVTEGNILTFNPDIRDKILQAKRPRTLIDVSYKTKIQPVVLLHFSDVHGYKAGLERIVTLMDYCADLIDDVIHTGDMVTDVWPDGIDFWSSTSGAEKILIAIGNHDLYQGPTSESQMYDRYMAPFIANWNVVNTQGLTYYYKDYSSKMVRLIVLNCMLSGTAATNQLTWLESTLQDAKTNNYTVVIADHYFVGDTAINCNFTSTDWNPFDSSGKLSNSYASVVDNYINGGGKFACWLVGHLHEDAIVRATQHNNQICIIVDAMSILLSDHWSDLQRIEGTKSQDLCNFVVIDTDSTLIKLIRVGASLNHNLINRNCITLNYTTGEIITQS